MRVALTGGIACGKSLVAKFLNELGIETIDADDIVHELIPEEERRRLARVVFNDPKARAELEARIHPLVREKIETFLCPPPPLTSTSPRIAVISLLFEAHWEGNFDIICCISSERDLQISRMMTARGYTRAEAEARMAAQMPVGEKAARSHYVIENNGSGEELKAKVAAFVGWLKERLRQADGRRV